MSDITDLYLNKVLAARKTPLNDRFSGQYIAEVVETNDPLNMHRIKFKCPELHDWDIKVEEAPWATVAFHLGGKRAGFWTHPCIGDLIVIEFEKGHPYSPICTGFANATRRRMYSYPSLYTESPVSVNQDGKPDKKPDDYDITYLPSDRRPMSTGTNDRYGNLDIVSSVGFYPREHDITPPPPGHDAISGKSFESKGNKPEINKPDKKYMARVSKYGMIFIQSDQGYYWKSDSEYGEFEGDFDNDEKFETDRWKYYQKLLNENTPEGDSRRIAMLTRYGHLFEMRDTGWAQKLPFDSKSRDEYGEGLKYLSKSERDMRWIKIRSKGGMLWQMIDVGSDPGRDTAISRKLIDEISDKVENEVEIWKDRDARQIRTVSRHGFKIVLDDRGSSAIDAGTEQTPHGNGILIKGRRAAVRSTVSQGFYWEFNENDEANHTSWGTPNGRSIELNDRYGYLMLSASMGTEWAPEWQGTKDNEFIRKPLMFGDAESTSYHLKLDDINQYVRLKTADNNNQGIEARDGDGPWVEMVGKNNRGVWLSDRYKLAIMRASDDTEAYVWIDEINRNITLYNNNGDVKIYSGTKIDIISNGDINFKSGGSITLNADESIKFKGGTCTMSLRGTDATFSNDVHCDSIYAALIPGADGQVEPLNVLDEILVPDQLSPDDRGKTTNGPFEECPLDEVRHPYNTSTSTSTSTSV